MISLNVSGFLFPASEYWLVEVDGLDSERFIASSILTMSIDDVDDVSSNDAVFRTVVDLTDAFLDRTEDGARRDDENRDERERQKNILFVRLLPEGVGVLRAEKSEVRYTKTRFCDVDPKSKKNTRY